MNRYFGLHILEGEWHSLLPRYLLLGDRVEGLRILDIGCGSGIGSSLLLEMGARMVDAIDHRPAVLELARMKHAKPGLDFHVMFWEELNFEDDTFDVVLCLDPSSPVTDPSLLHEVSRVLKPGGAYVCAIERKPIAGLEGLLPRYGYTDAAESIDLHGGAERPPQVGELANFFAKSTAIAQRPVLSYLFEGEGSDHKDRIPIDDQLRARDTDDAAVEMWFCGDESLTPPGPREIRLPYFSLVERLDQVINELQMRQIRGQHEDESVFDEILDDGPSEVFERERESTNEYRVVELDETPTRSKIPALRDDLSGQPDHPTFVRNDIGTPPQIDGLESQLAELSALYHQVRHEFQTVVQDAQQALDERDRYIQHLVGTVQQWQHHFDSEPEFDEPEVGFGLDEGTNVYKLAEFDAPAAEASDAESEVPPQGEPENDDFVGSSEPVEDAEPAEDVQDAPAEEEGEEQPEAAPEDVDDEEKPDTPTDDAESPVEATDDEGLSEEE